jgi:hypothetical protein
MSTFSEINRVFNESGYRGLVAASLRHAARIFESKTKVGREDEYIRWIRFAVPGMLNSGNVTAMDYAVANMPAGKPILEIGSFCGLSTTILSYLLEKYSRSTSIFTCDKWEFEGQQLGAGLGGSKSVTHDVYQTFVKESYIRNVKTFRADMLPYTIECFSDEFFQRWFSSENSTDIFGRSITLGGNISFCYIDGNHTYEFAKRDFENTNRALVPGGFILFDDSGDGTEWGSHKVACEVARGNEYELISKNPNYLFRKMK